MNRPMASLSRSRRALLSVLLSVGIAYAQSGCSAKIESSPSAGAGGVGGSHHAGGSAGLGLVATGGASVGLYVPGPHGSANQPCYPNGSCDPGFRCGLGFSCVFDYDVSGGSGPTFNGGADGIAGADATGTGGAAIGNGGSPPLGPPFCDPSAIPLQRRTPLPYAATDGFIGSGYQGNPAAITYSSCPLNDRAPGGVGQCNRWTYTPPETADEWVGVGYYRMWDAFYTHPPVCLADGVTFVEFYAKGAVGGEKVLFTAQGAADYEFTLTDAWQRYQIPMAGVVYNTATSGLEMGFEWKLVGPMVGLPIPGATFQVDSIQWVGANATGGVGGVGGVGGDSGEAGASAEAGAPPL